MKSVFAVILILLAGLLVAETARLTADFGII